MINGCNRENSKLIIENKSTLEKPKITKEKSKITNKVFINNNTKEFTIRFFIKNLKYKDEIMNEITIFKNNIALIMSN